ncbi:SDR family NAD(P)-dependent oxidoreductase [Pseudosulfitobacter pseudonitzschiae]|uniref:SDR family NAD(P)-dependent oxidoreductase n=1 Tax=Pseudosulfitobacter pseudonitzschiae TaxID=1402135 RepID=UPI001CCBA03D|nr:SDR family oxidoreductase [Pseudosulfitobacter pseudonitzschiae]MCA0135327.1 SDR family oxidoreductase [Pseudosulfitobacter pseudonitzschiae]MCD2326538.1 SDR family oxidoreductase [Pseudosulfitobacter pseudonitzschiae]MCD2351340.1 SDR family oxidoreductase [Pseudosulfitobacter pseudonitzschiae]MCI2216779.1 SDR family oxidoreductase [Pseudosulfitobacter pseudonitzschiae]UFE28053.1 SDR family oxidoreductase [Pseudosulfitobacter pseudonitzschiae]
MSKMFDLTGKVALLTGASKGMGLAMATALAEHGATVVISARKQDQLDEAAADINQAVGATRAHGVACNVGYKDQLQALVDQTRKIAGPIDIVVGNAGVNPYYGKTSQIPDDAYHKTMNANVLSNQWLATMVAPDMIEKGAGSMMFTSSIGAFKPSEMLGTYGMSKLALIGLVRNLAQEFGPQGIRFNAICPGLVKTDFARELWDNPEVEKRIQGEIPLRRLGEPDDFGGLAVYLASDASKYMTGQALTVCGGSNMWT